MFDNSANKFQNSFSKAKFGMVQKMKQKVKNRAFMIKCRFYEHVNNSRISFHLSYQSINNRFLNKRSLILITLKPPTNDIFRQNYGEEVDESETATLQEIFRRIACHTYTVELIAKQVGALSKDINSEDSIDKEVLHRISALQESTMSLRENIFDRQRVLSGILRSERFPNDIYPRLQLMIKDVNSLINHADFSFQRLDYIQDAALGLINIEQNGIVKIFSVAAVIFMPATLSASIYGMNFKAMPELDWHLTLSNGMVIPLGYLFAIALMIICSVLTIWFFRYKKWL